MVGRAISNERAKAVNDEHCICSGPSASLPPQGSSGHLHPLPEHAAHNTSQSPMINDSFDDHHDPYEDEERRRAERVRRKIRRKRKELEELEKLGEMNPTPEYLQELSEHCNNVLSNYLMLMLTSQQV